MTFAAIHRVRAPRYWDAPNTRALPQRGGLRPLTYQMLYLP